MRVAWRIGASLALAAVLWPGWQTRAAADTRFSSARVRFEPVGTTVLSARGVGTYRGALEVTRDGAGLSVVNDVAFEDYLRGISEMPPTWPTAALEAQAVAARTYALWEVLARPSDPGSGAQICASDSCQVYRGMDREREPGNAAWVAAVQATADQVLLYRGKVIEALYGSSNGGRTGDGGVPWLAPVDDPDDSASPLHSWHWTVPLSSLQAALNVPSGWDLTGVSQDGGTVSLSLQAADGSTATDQLPLTSFHDLVNANLPTPAGLPYPLPSWHFTVSTDGDQAVIDGGGFGHGMGLSQYGALGKAERGRSAADILASYYGGVRPSQLLPAQEPARIRVGLASGLASVVVGADGPFRVLGSDGHPLAVLGAGWWRVDPGSGSGVRVSPPAPYARPLSVDQLSVDQLGVDRLAVRFSLSLPAVVQVTVEGPDRAPVVLEPRLVSAGPVTLPIPPGPARGEYQVTVTADAGGGRSTTVPLVSWVGPPPQAAPGAAGAVTHHRGAAASGPRRPVLAAMAGAGLLLTSGAALATLGWRRRGSPLPAGWWA